MKIHSVEHKSEKIVLKIENPIKRTQCQDHRIYRCWPFSQISEWYHWFTTVSVEQRWTETWIANRFCSSLFLVSHTIIVWINALITSILWAVDRESGDAIINGQNRCLNWSVSFWVTVKRRSLSNNSLSIVAYFKFNVLTIFPLSKFHASTLSDC